MQFRITLLALFSVFSVLAQNGRKPLQGQVAIGELKATENEVKVTNTATRKSVNTVSGGYFTLSAKVGDTLLLTGSEFNPVKYPLSAKDASADLLQLKLTPTNTQLKEVTVQGFATSKSLGITPADPKHYTPAERKLKTARAIKPQRKPEDKEVAIGTDRVINGISGRTAQLKKEQKVENKEKAQALLSENYEAAFFTDTLNIPKEYVRGFLFYAVENDSLMKNLEADVRSESTRFQLNKLAARYKATLKNGRK